MRKVVGLILLGTALLALMSGCASNPGNPMASPVPYQTDILNSPMPLVSPGLTMVPGMGASPLPGVSPGATMMTSAQAAQAAQKISDEVVKLSEVDKATTVIVGDTALVGVSFDAQYKGEVTTRIKDMVTARAKAAEPNIARVAVTADPDLLTRIQNLYDKIASGAPMGDVTAEFTETINRLMPT